KSTVVFESVYGRYLCAEPDGKVVADRRWDSTWELFSMEPFPDCSSPPPVPCDQGGSDGSSSGGFGGSGKGRGGTLAGNLEMEGRGQGWRKERELGLDLGEGAAMGDRAGGEAGFSGVAKSHKRGACAKLEGEGRMGEEEAGQGQGLGGGDLDRFALRTYHGQYLGLDSERGTAQVFKEPVLWTANKSSASGSAGGIYGICHCEGAVMGATPQPASRRQMELKAHHQRMRATQSVAFVLRTREKYLSTFGQGRGQFSIREALSRLHQHKDPLVEGMTVSLAELMVLTAEDIREEGHPDWMQVVGLVHGLGRALHFMDEGSGTTAEERECALGEYSWVVGAPFPDTINCPSYNAANPDMLDPQLSNKGTCPAGMYQAGCGLGNTLLCFSGPEYMHMVLRHNKAAIPKEGMAMLQRFTLEPWHAGGSYTLLEDAEDRELKR
ncbi:unnamed protein product, partial [Discosporangium mesarthrocarpum]